MSTTKRYFFSSSTAPAAGFKKRTIVRFAAQSKKIPSRAGEVESNNLFGLLHTGHNNPDNHRHHHDGQDSRMDKESD